MDQLHKIVLDYVRREYLEEGDERSLTEKTKLI
jgi:hypothetical protein